MISRIRCKTKCSDLTSGTTCVTATWPRHDENHSHQINCTLTFLPSQFTRYDRLAGQVTVAVLQCCSSASGISPRSTSRPSPFPLRTCDSRAPAGAFPTRVCDNIKDNGTEVLRTVLLVIPLATRGRRKPRRTDQSNLACACWRGVSSDRIHQSIDPSMS